MSDGSFWSRFRSSRGAFVSLAFLATVAVTAVFGPWLVHTDPWRLVDRPFLPPFESAVAWLGTDTVGRDILAGLVQGARISLVTALASTATALVVGVAMGALSGYFGGALDALLMSVTEIFQAIPSFALAVVLVAIFQPSIVSTITAIGIVSWPPVARLVRGEVLSLRSRDYVQAALLSGESRLSVVVRQILPNALSPIIVMGSLMVATAILLESSLSFLGLGDPDRMSWGFMVGSARTVLRQAWWMAVFPGLAILCTVLALNVFGEALDAGLDARLSEGRA